MTCRLRWAFAVALSATACGRSDTTWHVESGYRWRALDVPWRGSPGFSLMEPGRTHIGFVNTVSDSLLLRNRVLAQGGGVCLGDVDRDGMPDVFLARTEGPNALYRNLGDFRFEDVTARAGVAAPDRYSTGCAFADVDGDGDLDLVLLALGGPNALFLNDGSARFIERRDPALASTAGSATVALADVDGDGWLDMYITNYKAYSTIDRMSPQERSFANVVREIAPGRFEVRESYRDEYKLVEREDIAAISLVQRADPDFFYRNTGDGRFVRESIAQNRRFLDEEGLPIGAEPEHFGLAAMFADLDGDRAPELYVVNDFEDPDLVWKNDGHGGFRLVSWFAIRSTSNSGMAVDVGDVDRDGHPDLFQVDMLSHDTRRLKTQVATHTAVPKLPGQTPTRPQMQRNTLQWNRGDGTFAEIARYAGVGASGWSWSTLFLDVDLDGWEDLLIGNGHRWDVMDGDTQRRLHSRLQEIDWRRMLFEYPPLPLSNVAFRNRGDMTFEDASAAWKFDLGPDLSHGMATADLDGDGDQDVVINRLDSPAAVLRNNSTAARVAVRLMGERGNTAGIGSTVRVIGGAVPRQQREVLAGGLYLSSSDPMLTFATGDADDVTIEVDWRDGRRSVILRARPDRLYEIDQAGATGTPKTPSNPAETLFVDVTSHLGGHEHVETYFDDYRRQLLLPSSLSQLGPGVAWFDVDSDGDEDLVVGAGRGGTLALFRNEDGRMTRSGVPFAPAPVDLTTIVGWHGAQGPVILAGVSSYEMGTVRNALRVPGVVGYSPATGAMSELVPGDAASVGPIAVTDYDGDGDLDLFVGSRVVPAAYPTSSMSRFFRNDDGRLVLDDVNTPALPDLGMVSAAVFSDLDGNGWPDLIVAREWGGIRIFSNEAGRFSAPREPSGLAGVSSRWIGLATGDVDGDGLLDILATSWGRNTEHRVSPDRPLYGYQVRTARGPEVVLAQEDRRVGGIAPLASFERIGLVLPTTAMRLGTFTAYADARIDVVLGSAYDGAPPLQARTMDHMVFLNRGERFEARSLPMEAQIAPASYVGIADFDGDGREDAFLSQNFFATEIGTPRYDAGRGVLLLGDGAGRFTAMPGQRSGLMIYGEQRGAAFSDFDRDGRVDLVVTQNAGPTRLYRNVGATPGIRVRIAGPPANPHGIGAVMRLRYGDRAGPVREVQAGSGYWSQNGATQVLGKSGEPTSLWVRWPGGREQVVQLTAGQREVLASHR